MAKGRRCLLSVSGFGNTASDYSPQWDFCSKMVLRLNLVVTSCPQDMLEALLECHRNRAVSYTSQSVLGIRPVFQSIGPFTPHHVGMSNVDLTTVRFRDEHGLAWPSTSRFGLPLYAMIASISSMSIRTSTSTPHHVAALCRYRPGMLLAAPNLATSAHSSRHSCPNPAGLLHIQASTAMSHIWF